MPVTNVDCGVWSLDEVYLKIQANRWVCYSQQNDPGTLWSWGYNSQGALGDGTTIDRSSPVQVPGISWVEVRGGGGNPGFSAARKSDGTLWTWGYNAPGNLGDNTRINRSSPVQVPGSSWTAVSVGGGFVSTGALKSDGTLWTWGSNAFGQLGQGISTTVCRSSPVQVPGTSWVEIDMSAHSVARKSDGTLWTWGRNNLGQLGNGTIINSSSPIQVPGSSWVQIGGAGGGNSTARKSDGTLWTWGRGNGFGTLGNNSVIDASSPVQVAGNSWVDSFINSSSYYMMARKSDGTLWTWGRNTTGVLGDGTTVYRSSPVQVPGTAWAEIASGGNHSMARKSDGTLWSWGYNVRGALGTNNTVYASSPVQVPGTCWIQIGGGGRHSLARKNV